jgi:hypothetical protein
MNIEKEIQAVRDSYDKAISQSEKSYCHGFLLGLHHCEPEIKRLRKAIEDHKQESDSDFCTYMQRDRRLWEVLE